MRSLERAHEQILMRRPVVLFYQLYQLDFTTPGISPLRASERKQRRQTPNLRRKARGRPQSWQRLCWRDLNFGFFASLTRFAVVDITFTLILQKPVAVARTGRVTLPAGRACRIPSAAHG